MNKKTKRQAMTVTIKQLRKLADDSFFELLTEVPGVYESPKDILNQKIQITIINKTPEQSDTWRIE